jgi:hypothetical protein
MRNVCLGNAKGYPNKIETKDISNPHIATQTENNKNNQREPTT